MDGGHHSRIEWEDHFATVDAEKRGWEKPEATWEFINTFITYEMPVPLIRAASQYVQNK
jgi:hypothetical protein